MAINLNSLAGALTGAGEQPAAPRASRDQYGTIALDAEGTPTVMLDGGEDYAPCTCMVGVHHGDRVLAHVVNHKLVVFANITAPTTDDATALVAVDRADAAAEAADAAGIAAASAQGSADAAATAASNAQTSANNAAAVASAAQSSAGNAAAAASVADGKAVAAGNAATAAQASATSANRHANAALDQLGIVQDVIGVLEWASSHGTFAKTADTAIVDGKVYFTYDGTDYAPVVSPDAAQLANYYELSMTEAMNEFILAHLAVTQRGLWVLPSGIGSASDEQHAPGYKLLLASDGSYLYDASGVLVRSDTASGTTFASSNDWHVGGEDAYIFYDASEGTLTIGGSSIVLGGGKALSELIDESGTRGYSVEVSASAPDITGGGTVGLTAKVRKDGAELTATEVLRVGCVKWYRADTGARVATGLSCTVSADARYIARLEG